MSSGSRPTFRTKDLLTWLDSQIAVATRDREIIAQQLKDERKKDKRSHKRRNRDRKRSRRHETSSSESSSEADSEKALNALGCDDHDFRKLAREHPGVTFASVVADCRAELGQKGLDLDVGPQGPVFWKWFETVFTQRSPLAPGTNIVANSSCW